MKPKEGLRPEKFGDILGFAPGNVPVYSSDYTSMDEKKYPERKDLRSSIDGIYMGYKWQCVEFARRWLYLNKGYVFSDVAMAYDIFSLNKVQLIKDNTFLPLNSFKNGSRKHPEVGCLLIWEEGGEFEITGHVAIVTEVQEGFIRIAEQNLDHQKWPEGQSYSRQLNTKIDDENGFWIESQLADATILGWVVQTEDNEFAEVIAEPDHELFNLHIREVHNQGQAKTRWLNIANPDEAAYVKSEGHSLVRTEEDEYKYVCMSKSCFTELIRATNELHHMFLTATNFVLKNDKLLEKFCIPKSLWPRLHKSWDNRRNEMITGRMDFSVSEHGIKIYEYNADSAACYIETGKIQDKWAENFNCTDGHSGGEILFEHLVEAWEKSEVNGTLHIMKDHDSEENYHALFMKAAIEEAGINVKLITGTEGLAWDKEGHILDQDKEVVKWVWKTWAWESALDQVRAHPEKDFLATTKNIDLSKVPKLADVLLSDRILVFEPFWTLIPSNKAILPILWEMFPEHPYLLNSQFNLTPALQEKGYVTKPIVGRCGDNISIFDKTEGLLSKTEGRFENRDQIFQEYFPLPKPEKRYLQVSTFTASGIFSGACVRADSSKIVVSSSDIPALRILSDSEFERQN